MSVVPPTGIVRKYYEDAVEDIEYRSSAFWQVWLQREFARDSNEFQTYAVTSEYSPDGSRRRVDQVVRRYDRDNHNLCSMIWNECKRPSGSAGDAESQALDAAKRCIQRENLMWIYALTTVGLTFRVWKMMKSDLQLKPLGATKYIDADSADAWILRAAIQEVKDYFPVGDGGVLPSQAHLLEEYAGEPGESSAQGTEQWPTSDTLEGFGQQTLLHSTWSADEGEDLEMSQSSLPLEGYGQQQTGPPAWSMGLDEQQGVPPATGEFASSMQETYHDDAAGSLAAGRTAAQTTETWSKVVVHKIRHLTRPPEYSFTTNNNHAKITARDDWKETEYKGKRAWYHRHKGVHYYTREKP